MNLIVERASAVPSRYEDEILRQHPELKDGQHLTLRPSTSTAGPRFVGAWLPGDVPDGSAVEFSPRRFAGKVEGWDYEIREWRKREEA